MAKTNVRGTQILDASVDLTVDVTGTLPIANGGTDTASLPTGLLKGAGTGAITAVTAPTGAVVGDSDVQILNNKRITKRIGTTASSATPSIDCGLYDQYNITALAAAITSITITGTPTDAQPLMIRIKDNGTVRTIAWGGSFVSSGVATLLATTVANKTHMVGLIYDSAATTWVCMAVDSVGY